MPNDANSSAQSDGPSSGASIRQKRIMPSRSRRGGPGLGHCDVDILILETQRRKLENEPLIPAETPFLLTTDPKYASETLNSSESGIQINIVANDRYFDRPDVLKAFRDQSVIQTPEYEAISESISGVGGRFRPRGQEEAVAETSDATYEKRHRKFENFEKRQRLREKEKLKHEHYKLKERIEQLRSMDGVAFMTLPASAFSPAPQDEGFDVEETPSSPYVAMNGGLYHAEGERRRKEMLDIAIRLEKRYAYLLPPRKVPDIANAAGSTKDTESRDGEESEAERDPGIAPSRKDGTTKLRTQSVKSSASSTPSSPIASRSLLSKKSWLTAPTIVEANQSTPSTRSIRNSISTSSEPPESLPPIEGQQVSSPIFYVVDEVSEVRGSPQPIRPPLPSQFVWNVSTPITLGVSPEPSHQRRHPLDIQNGTHSVEDESLEPLGNSQPKASGAEDVSQQDAMPTSQNDVHVADDGKFEKAPSEVGYVGREPEMGVPEPQPKKRRGRPPKRLDNEEMVVPIAVEVTPVPIESPEPGQVQKKRRGRKSQIALLQEASLSDVRTQRTRLQQNVVTETPRTIEVQQPDVISSHNIQEPVESELIDPISTRPVKRRRRNREHAEEFESISAPPGRARTASITSDRGVSISATSSLLRGKTYVTYVDNRTGETIRSPSLLMIASVRAAEKTNVRRSRETTSFGVPTPEFGKGAIMDYELQEDILYRHLRDKSPIFNESEVLEPNVGENREQHETVGGEGSNRNGGDDGGVGQREKEQLIGPESAEEHQLSGEKDEAMEDEEHGAAEELERLEHQGQDVQRSPETKSTEQIADPRRPYHVLIYQGPLDEELVASPEAEPLTELPPGVRPREPSRRIDDDDDELEW